MVTMKKSIIGGQLGKMSFGLIGLLLVCFISANAQDPQLVQFYHAPLQLNPAMTGVHPGKWRASANYREQWNSILDTRPFRTVSTSFDMRSPVGQGDFIAYGFTAMRDEAGKSSYTRLTGDLSVAYMKQLDGSRYRQYDQYLIGGIQAGFGQHSLDYSRLWFSSQFDLVREQVDYSLPNMENIDETSSLYPNVNAGLLWYAVFDENKSLYAGGALHHVNAPRISFISQDGVETLDMKWVVQAGGELPFNKRFSALPAVAVMGQGPSLLSLSGVNFRYTNRDWKEIAIRVGGWVHVVKDFEKPVSVPALTFVSILEMERLGIGISYDVGISKLAQPTNGRGAFELSVIYYQPATRREKVNCPKM